MKWFFYLLPLSLYAVQPHHETAFIGQSGEIDALFSYSYYKTNRFWNHSGKSLKAYNDFRRDDYDLYLEYALNCNNAFWVNGGFSQVHESMHGQKAAVKDIEFAWKHLWRETCTSALSSELVGIAPVGDKKSSVRYGEWGAQFNVLYSKYYGFGWIDTLLGYRWYNGNPSDQIRAMAAIGFNIGSKSLIIATADLQYGLNNGHEHFNSNFIAFNPNYRLLLVKAEWVYNVFSHFSLVAGGFGHVWGENVGQGGGFYVGSWLDY